MELKVIKKVEQENGNTVLTLVGVDTAISGVLCYEVPAGTIFSIGDKLDADIVAESPNLKEEIDVMKSALDFIIVNY